MFEMILAIGGSLVGAGVISGVTRSLFYHYKPKAKGHADEAAVHRTLQRFCRKDGARLRDLLVPFRNATTQIDNILINRFGVFVIESKNYTGRILGGEKDQMWQHETGGKQKLRHPFLNPTIQNNSHVAALRILLKNHPKLKYYPITVFSNSCQLTNVTPNVVQLRDLPSAIKMRCSGNPVLSAEEVRAIKYELQTLNISDRKARKEHALRASLSASAAHNPDKSGLARMYEQARNAPTLFVDEHPEPKQETPKEHAMLTDTGAMVRIRGKTDSIQKFFEKSKRDKLGLPVSERASFDHFVCPYTGKSFSVSEARPFYRGLWAAYLKQNPELVAYLERLGPDRIRCASLRTETLLRSYVQDRIGFQNEIRQSLWYQNLAAQQKNKKELTQRQALDKILTEHPVAMTPTSHPKPSLDRQIEVAGKTRQPSKPFFEHLTTEHSR